MTLTQTQLSYRRLAVEGASPIGMLVALLDQLVSDLRRAATALHRDDIETRCRELNHAALVLGQLESWVDQENGGDTALLLTRFYAIIRSKMMEASVKKSAEVLEKQIEEIVHVRTRWQKLDSAPLEPGQEPKEHAIAQSYSGLAAASDTSIERIPFSQTG